MAVSFFKKSFSAAYYGYENKITNPDTLDDDEEASDESESETESRSPAKSDHNKVQRLAKSKSAIEIVNLAKKNLVDKLSTNVTKLATYDHHSLLKSIQKEDDSTPEDDDDEFEDNNRYSVKDQLKECLSFNLYEQERSLSLKPNQPFGLLNPSALPIELKEQLSQSETPCTNDENSSDEYEKIEFDRYDEYGFLRTTQTKKCKENDENLLKIDDSEDSSKDAVQNEEITTSTTPADEQSDQVKEKAFEKLKNKWLTYLELTYNQVDEPTTKWYQIESKLKHTAQLDNLIQSGSLPYFLRNQLWPRFSNAYLMKEKCEFAYSQLCKKSNHIRNFNDKHSLRILPNNICFQDQSNKLNQSLRRVLRVIKWIERNGIDPISNKNLQSLNLPLIAAYLLLVFNEEDAFWLLLSILNEWKLIFANKALISRPNDDDLIRNLVKKYCPDLDAKLGQEEIDINILINGWLTSLFADVINDTQILFYLWDLYFYYGFIVIFQITFGLLLYKKDELIKFGSSVDLINTISSLPDELSTADRLLELWQTGKDNLDNLDQEVYTIKNHNELQGELLRIGVPAVQLFNENTSGIKLLPSASLNRLSDLNNELKFKNVRQSAILMELHEAILAIGQHFQSNESDSTFNLTIDYDIKEINKFYKTHKSGLNKTRSKDTDEKKKEKCKRARALIDFKRIDDDELGFRKNDIIKILNDRDEHCWEGRSHFEQKNIYDNFLSIEILI